MRITQVNIVPIDRGDLVAYAEFTIDNCFRVREVKLFRRAGDYSIGMPQTKEKGRYREVASALNAKTRKMIEDALVVEYQKIVAKRTR
jgi:DNA-binding cell septation regulator SpoVG